MDLAFQNNERFIVDSRDEPAVAIMSVKDVIRLAVRLAAKRLAGAKRRGLEAVTLDDIKADIGVTEFYSSLLLNRFVAGRLALHYRIG
jgi:hypothetical protein